MQRPHLDFWFEFASTYSYPAAMRIGPLAREASVEVRFRPFLLGPIFKAQGWNTSPFNLYLAKGRYMWRDLERICAELDLPFRRPDPFPQMSVSAARLALVGLAEGWGEDFCRAVYRAEFQRLPQRKAPRSRCGCASTLRRRSGLACSVPRASSLPMTRSFGAMTGSMRRLPGPGARSRFNSLRWEIGSWLTTGSVEPPTLEKNQA